MKIEFNQFPCNLEANFEASVGGGRVDVGGGYYEEDWRPDKAPEAAEE